MGNRVPRIQTFTAGTVQALTVPKIIEFPDERVSILPPTSSSAPYLLFGTGYVPGQPNGTAVVLEPSDLQTFTFATNLGYQPVVMQTLELSSCNPADDTTFDENYGGPVFVAQDPTLPPG